MRSATRAGFTLVELMVAMALTLFVMVILSQAFVTSLETFSAMKGIGDMQMNLRTAGNILRNDLSQNHLDGDRRLSDVTSAGASPLVKFPNQSGFFAILQETQLDSLTTYVTEGTDSNSVPSYRAVDHVLYMTVRRRGNRPENFFTAVMQDTSVATNLLSPSLAAFSAQQTAYNLDPAAQLSSATYVPPYPGTWSATQAYVPGSLVCENPGTVAEKVYSCTQPNTGKNPAVPANAAFWTLQAAPNPANQAFYSSQWAEVVYFLVQTGSTEEPNNPKSTIGTPTYGLYRAQFVMVPNGTNVNSLFTVANGYPAVPPSVVNHPNQVALSQQVFAGLSTTNPSGTNVLFNSPDDAAMGQRVISPANLTPTNFKNLLATDGRFQVSDASGATQSYAANLVLPNVLSFQIQVMPAYATNFGDLPTYLGQPAGSAYALFDTAQFNATAFPNYPATARTALKGIQITLRVFDSASRQSRQMTIVQNM